ncbi:MAG: histone deacetylase family protein [Alphaproteobacteria bacterium]|nr:histone deacetylase family protein [Alphaproteobacteria bacterium]
MTSYIYYHHANEAHDTGAGHSERAERLTQIVKALRQENLASVVWPDVPVGNRADIERVHTKQYVDFVFNSVPQHGYKEIEINEVVSDDDGGEVTVLSPMSGEALLRSVGQVTSAVDAVMNGKASNCFCLTRPPGHHALIDKAMGFCVFGNAVIAARYAQEKFGSKRIAIVDYDVHHGNGTQDIVKHDNSIFFASIHQLPLWPETGYAHETGTGNILNAVVPPGSSREEWLKSWNDNVIRRLESENFELMIICAGFDAHKNDPKGAQNLETRDFYDITRQLLRISAQKCGGKAIILLEGGYNIDASASSAVAVAHAMISVG